MSNKDYGLYIYKGYVISRESYVDTIDDRCDRWYIAPPLSIANFDVARRYSDAFDRRGRGFRLLRIAKAAIDDRTGRDFTED